MIPIITKTEIDKSLTDLGVKAGMMLEAHCSLASFGHVDGGALTIIEALKNAVGMDGAIVMPSFMLSPPMPLSAIDKELGLTLKIKILQNENEKSSMGIVSDTFIKMPGVITGEGTFRVSAWGKDAEKHAATGFRHLIDSNGHALLMGVDIYSMSAMHYAEDSLPVVIRNLFNPPEEAQKMYPEPEWLIEAWAPTVKPWHTIQERAYKKGFITDTMIGNSKCMLAEVKNVIELYRQALQTEPFELYGLKQA